eukprot:2610095-Alexandrium_andersonii.AAC.1
MSASLVGSEMCIRDSPWPAHHPPRPVLCARARPPERRRSTRRWPSTGSWWQPGGGSHSSSSPMS